MTAQHDDLVAHEAAHAAVALLLGLHVKAAHVDPASCGRVICDINPRDPAELRALLIATLAGGLADRTPGWPPQPPLSATPATSDELDVGRLARLLNLDRKQYAAVVQAAHATVACADYRLLHTAISILLEERHHLEERDLERVKAIVQKPARKTAPSRRGTLNVVAKVRPVATPRPPARPFVPVRLPRWTTI